MQSRTYFYGIDAIRFVSAFGVAVYHLAFWSWAGIFTTVDQTRRIFDGAAAFPDDIGWTWFGWVGVEIFFVISGFVIAESADGRSASGFLKGRILRLYPAAWICATCALVAYVVIAREPVLNLAGPYLKSMLLFPHGRWIDGVYWTLSVEIAFYALIYIVLAFGKFESIHLVAWGLTCGSGAFVALGLAIRSGAALSPAAVAAFHALDDLTPITLLNHGCLFAVGLWLWIAGHRPMSPNRWLGFAVASVCGAMEVYSRGLELLETVPATAGQSPLVPLAIWAGATSCIVAFAVAGERLVPASAPVRNVLRTAGLMTYPFYLLHDMVGAGICRFLIAAGMSPWMAVGSALFAIGVLSFLVCRRLEPVLGALLKRGLGQLEIKLSGQRRSLVFAR